MRHVRPVTRRIATLEYIRIAARFYPDAPFLDRQKLPRSFEMRGATQFTAGPQLHLIKLDILLQVQRRQRTNCAVFIRPEVIGTIARANHR